MSRDSDTDNEFFSIDVENVKVKPWQIDDELKRRIKAGESRKSIKQLATENTDLLWAKTIKIYENYHNLSSREYCVLYRVHGKNRKPDTESQAEKAGQTNALSGEQKTELLRAHCLNNRKSIENVHSPFVSTTSDIRSLISITFGGGTAADPNLRNDVFEHANFVSIFRVPRKACSAVTQGPGYGEKEVLFDTEKGKLSDFQEDIIRNPFKDYVFVNLKKMSNARGQALNQEVEMLDKKYDAILKDEPITPEIAKEYTQWFEEQKLLSRKLLAMPKRNLMNTRYQGAPILKVDLPHYMEPTISSIAKKKDAKLVEEMRKNFSQKSKVMSEIKSRFASLRKSQNVVSIR